MRRDRIMRIILVLASLLIIIGVILMCWMFGGSASEGNVLRVKLNGGETKPLTFESLTLVPGEECEYTLKFIKTNASKYDLSLDFLETVEKTLKNYARVKIVSSNEVLCDELLADAFEDSGIVLPVDFNTGKNTELKMVFYLPIDVGNEAKRAEAAFELLLTATVE